ncbi:sodium channel protein Nach-like [Uranotaenia lowii]|uniref:sodium channel protein Nach-like n=1 Tax=Uranotaenia lowii TaxID=190385 RepID=UPI0024788E57|nr:sodium channel protein Nach-like [Uranotaenia lowii]
MKPQKSNLTAKRLLRSSLLVQIREFFTLSTLHGVRYVTERDRPFREKFCWFALVNTSAVTTLIIIFNLWQKFQTNPTITGPDTASSENSTTFPTVLVCPADPLDQSKILEVAEKLKTGDDLNKTIEYLLQLPLISYKTLAKVKFSLFPPNLNIRELIFRIAVDCELLIYDCWFRVDEIECCAHFKSVYFEHGFCYGFNGQFVDTATGM